MDKITFQLQSREVRTVQLYAEQHGSYSEGCSSVIEVINHSLPVSYLI